MKTTALLLSLAALAPLVAARATSRVFLPPRIPEETASGILLEAFGNEGAALRECVAVDGFPTNSAGCGDWTFDLLSADGSLAVEFLSDYDLIRIEFRDSRPASGSVRVLDRTDGVADEAGAAAFFAACTNPAAPATVLLFSEPPEPSSPCVVGEDGTRRFPDDSPFAGMTVDEFCDLDWRRRFAMERDFALAPFRARVREAVAELRDGGTLPGAAAAAPLPPPDPAAVAGAEALADRFEALGMRPLPPGARLVLSWHVPWEDGWETMIGELPAAGNAWLVPADPPAATNAFVLPAGDRFRLPDDDPESGAPTWEPARPERAARYLADRIARFEDGSRTQTRTAGRAALFAARFARLGLQDEAAALYAALSSRPGLLQRAEESAARDLARADVREAFGAFTADRDFAALDAALSASLARNLAPARPDESVYEGLRDNRLAVLGAVRTRLGADAIPDLPGLDPAQNALARRFASVRSVPHFRAGVPVFLPAAWTNAVDVSDPVVRELLSLGTGAFPILLALAGDDVPGDLLRDDHFRRPWSVDLLPWCAEAERPPWLSRGEIAEELAKNVLYGGLSLWLTIDSKTAEGLLRRLGALPEDALARIAFASARDDEADLAFAWFDRLAGAGALPGWEDALVDAVRDNLFLRVPVLSVADAGRPFLCDRIPGVRALSLAAEYAAIRGESARPFAERLRAELARFAERPEMPGPWSAPEADGTGEIRIDFLVPARLSGDWNDPGAAVIDEAALEGALAAWDAAFRAWAERVADAFAGAAGAPGDAESVRARAEALAAWREARFSADRETKESLSRPPVPLLAGGVTTGGALAPPPLPQIRRLSPGRKTLTPTTTSAEGAE